MPTYACAAKLDRLNFFLADVRDGLGPYLAIYLLTVHDWKAGDIGLVMALGGLAGLASQIPAGALVDWAKDKRVLIVMAAALVTLSCLVALWQPGFTWIVISQVAAGMASSVFAPALAGITLGIVGPKAFTRRIARNESFNHAGNATAALLAGAFAYLWGPAAVFYLMTGMALLSMISALGIPPNAIDADRARGRQAGAALTPLRHLLSQPPLVLLALSCALFHLANAAMLPLVGQKLALANPDLATTLISACIVAAQLVMIPAAMLVGARADSWGRKPLLMTGFLILPIRGVLYTLSDDPIWLVSVQLLDGIGAGLFGALIPLMVRDLTQGSGHFNISLAAVSLVFGIGAALSNGLAGYVAEAGGYDSAFLVLAAVAGCAALLLMFLPETLRTAESATQSLDLSPRAAS
ncbi:MFS transporter [Pseudomonas sp. MM211]|uniref:MFS transporter n=1 Tax=Pseudomonas sp. MM211 TaxID=2866808 RepID=UPI001CED5D16|nr:MFS transporter [Pseudomonas sp. MM211]UCJ15794.1 MFS transporter [Pseudomonas sp. MM211]